MNALSPRYGRYRGEEKVRIRASNFFSFQYSQTLKQLLNAAFFYQHLRYYEKRRGGFKNGQQLGHVFGGKGRLLVDEGVD